MPYGYSIVTLLKYLLKNFDDYLGSSVACCDKGSVEAEDNFKLNR
jgi:hypothetical protein